MATTITGTKIEVTELGEVEATIEVTWPSGHIETFIVPRQLGKVIANLPE